MFLIHTKSLELHHFHSEEDVQYAILSHRWEHQEEVDFHEFRNGKGTYKKGFNKIKSACKLASLNNDEYLWIDTVCIDSSSSAALSEAINSMHRYYGSASVCYAYLNDVEVVQAGHAPPSFECSSWFTRSWTLQELLAPPDVFFYDHRWTLFGSRTSLLERITNITQIDPAALMGDSLDHFSVAERMSWASRREATRVEDIAYSLLGIFDINMPMLYGEGEKAFVRLQEHILQQTTDHTIFAWDLETAEGTLGLLATSPRAFARWKGIRPLVFGSGQSSASITSRGIAVDLSMRRLDDGIYEALLDAVFTPGTEPDQHVGIYLAREKGFNDQYVRTHYGGQALWMTSPYTLSETHWVNARIHIKQHVGKLKRPSRKTEFDIMLLGSTSLGSPTDLSQAVKWSNSCVAKETGDADSRAKVYTLRIDQNGSAPICTIDMTDHNTDVKLIHFAIDEDVRPVCLILDSKYLDLHGDSGIFDNIKQNRLEWYPRSLPWSGHSFRGLLPPEPYRGLWAVIGNSRQSLRFKADSRTIKELATKSSKVTKLFGSPTPSSKKPIYVVDVSMLFLSQSLKYTWDIRVMYKENERV